MTTNQAAELRRKWEEQGTSRSCNHYDLILEQTDTGYLTGHYHCIVCGESIVQNRM